MCKSSLHLYLLLLLKHLHALDEPQALILNPLSEAQQVMYVTTTEGEQAQLQSTRTRARSSSEEKEPDQNEDEQLVCSTGFS